MPGARGRSTGSEAASSGIGRVPVRVEGVVAIALVSLRTRGAETLSPGAEVQLASGR